MKFIYVVGLAVASYLIYKYKQKAQKLLMVHSNNRLSRLFHLINAKLFENFKPSFFLFSGHAQTVFLEVAQLLVNLFKTIFKFYSFKYERKIFKLSDGCQIAIDQARKTKLSKKFKEYDKILVVLPGVTSTSEDYYVKAFIEDFCEEFDCRVINARGFGGMPLFSPKMISSECYLDVKEYIEYVCKENSNKKVFGVGFSMGGMMLARYLGSVGDKVPENFHAGCGLCYPCCLEQTKNYAEVHFNGLYSKASLSNVKTTFFNNLDVIFQEKFFNNMGDNSLYLERDKIIQDVRDCTLLSDFDRIYTTRILGLKSVYEYYDNSKLENYLKNIKVPFLSIFSEDDPIVPIDSIPFKSLQSNTHTVTVVTQHGGHLGFFGGLLIPERIIEQPFRTFMRTVEILKDTESCKCKGNILD